MSEQKLTKEKVVSGLRWGTNKVAHFGVWAVPHLVRGLDLAKDGLSWVARKTSPEPRP
jgi:hypothetical protein